MADKWIQAADERMDDKGTRGSFGKATDENIRKGKRAGGKRKKKAVFAENMRKIARKHKRGGRRSSSRR